MRTLMTTEMPADVMALIFMGYHPQHVQTGGHLGEVLNLAIQQRCTPTLHEIEDACGVELTLRYGCAVRRLAVMGATDGLVAVGFDAAIINTKQSDPVDVLIPWQAAVADFAPLRQLRTGISAMLRHDRYGFGADSAAERLVEHFRAMTAGPCPVRSQAALVLWQQVPAANIKLVVDAQAY
jgi:hypothetical protein